MITSFTLILICQLAGEVIAKTLNLPTPGPVVGMALMFILLALRDSIAHAMPKFTLGREIEPMGRSLLSHLSLLFVPAGVGIVRSLDIFVKYGFALAAALIISTTLALLVSVATFRTVSRLVGDAQ